MALRRHHGLGCAVLLITLGPAGLPARAQSLVQVAQAARLAREARARHAPPGKVYTDDDLRDTGGLTTRVARPAPSGSSTESLLVEALERERLLHTRLRTRPATPLAQPAPAPSSVRQSPPAAVAAPAPAPTPPPGGIPLSLVYGWSPAIVVPTNGPRRGHAGQTTGLPQRHRRRSDEPGRRTQTQTDRGRHQPEPRTDAPDRRPTARNGYAESSRPFAYVAPGLRVPALAVRGESPASHRER